MNPLHISRESPRLQEEGVRILGRVLRANKVRPLFPGPDRASFKVLIDQQLGHTYQFSRASFAARPALLQRFASGAIPPALLRSRTRMMRPSLPPIPIFASKAQPGTSRPASGWYARTHQAGCGTHTSNPDFEPISNP